MKKILAVIVAIALAGGLVYACSGASKSQKHTSLTAKSVYETCKSPEEVHPINTMAYGVRAIVMRHSECLGYQDVLVVIWDGPRTERNKTAAKLLMLLYVDFVNNQNPNEPVDGFHLKTDNLLLNGEETNMAFYQLKKRPVQK